MFVFGVALLTWILLRVEWHSMCTWKPQHGFSDFSRGSLSLLAIFQEEIWSVASFLEVTAQQSCVRGWSPGWGAHLGQVTQAVVIMHHCPCSQTGRTSLWSAGIKALLHFFGPFSFLCFSELIINIHKTLCPMSLHSTKLYLFFLIGL